MLGCTTLIDRVLRLLCYKILLNFKLLFCTYCLPVALLLLDLILVLCSQNPLPYLCFISISAIFCQELQSYHSLQCLLHVFISVTSLDQQYFAQRGHIPQWWLLHLPSTCIQWQARLGQMHNFSFQVCQKSKKKKIKWCILPKSYNKRSILQLPTLLRMHRNWYLE